MTRTLIGVSLLAIRQKSSGHQSPKWNEDLTKAVAFVQWHSPVCMSTLKIIITIKQNNNINSKYKFPVIVFHAALSVDGECLGEEHSTKAVCSSAAVKQLICSLSEKVASGEVSYQS